MQQRTQHHEACHKSARDLAGRDLAWNLGVVTLMSDQRSAAPLGHVLITGGAGFIGSRLDDQSERIGDGPVLPLPIGHRSTLLG